MIYVLLVIIIIELGIIDSRLSKIVKSQERNVNITVGGKK